MNYLRTIIYTTATVDIVDFRARMYAFLKVKPINISFFQTEDYEVLIWKNDDFNEVLQKEFPDGFLRFKFKIEIEFRETRPNEYCVAEVGRILFWLWENKMPAVASCDFEDSLPNKGGYQARGIPWPH